MVKGSLLTTESEKSLEKEPWSGCSSDLKQDSLRELKGCDPRKVTRELVLDLHKAQSTTCCLLKKIEKSEQAKRFGSSYC